MTVTSDFGAFRVLVVDDHPLFRAGFVAAWRHWRGQDRVLEAESVRAALRGIEAVSCDVAIVDIRLPDGSGLELCEHLSGKGVSLIIVLSTYDGAAIVEASRRVGARGFLSKETAIGGLFQEVDRLLRYASATCFPDTSALPRLTSRELEVLYWLIQGQSNPEISRRLGVGVETVKSHVSAVLGHMGARDRFEAVEVARGYGFDVALPHLRDA